MTTRQPKAPAGRAEGPPENAPADLPAAATYRIFGKPVRVVLSDQRSDEVLTRELALYPRVADGARAELVVAHEPVDPDAARARNPAVHSDFADGLLAEFRPLRVRFETEGSSLKRVRFSTRESGSAIRRVLGRWRNIQFATRAEAIGQAVHELVLVPATYFDTHLVPVHAAAVQADSGSVALLGGTGGVGKTSLELELCRRHGMRFFADDIAVVTAGGDAWPNLAYPKLYAYNVQGDAGLRDIVLADDGLAGRLQWHGRVRRHGMSSVRRRVSPATLFGRHGTEGGSIGWYFLLLREARDDFRVESIDADRAAELSIAVMCAEYGAFHNHLFWHEFNRRGLGGNPAITFEDVIERWRRVLPRALADAECLIIRVPIHVDHERFRATVADLVLQRMG